MFTTAVESCYYIPPVARHCALRAGTRNNKCTSRRPMRQPRRAAVRSHGATRHDGAVLLARACTTRARTRTSPRVAIVLLCRPAALADLERTPMYDLAQSATVLPVVRPRACLSCPLRYGPTPG